MSDMKIRGNEEIEKIIVQPGDAVFIKYDKSHKPIIKIFQDVMIC